MIDSKIEGKIARITLNRPEKRNALDDRMIVDLLHALSLAGLRHEVAVTAISGAGPDFCTGMDIAMLQETENANVLEHLESARTLGGMYCAIRRHAHPVVAAVRGRALGGGCGIATACDVVLAAESAQFGYPEVNIGFVPAIVMSMLRRTVGEKRAFEMLVSGKPVSAREALEIGLITRVFADADFETRVDEYLRELSEKSVSAVALTKRLLHHIDGMSFEAAIEAGAEINAIARTTEDARQGFRRFSKRK
ncbi:MAG TPA: enoyl-CoA hydratase/isomerase family protein [Bryobacteraceae bacterium]